MSYETLTDALEHMKQNKWSADNVAFGSGGALLQKVDSNTQQCAYRCSYIMVNGKGVRCFCCTIQILCEERESTTTAA